jgi:hypothetical protein
MLIAGRAGSSPTWTKLFVNENLIMLRLAIVFLVIAPIAGFFGFAGVANSSWEGQAGHSEGCRHSKKRREESDQVIEVLSCQQLYPKRPTPEWEPSPTSLA